MCFNVGGRSQIDKEPAFNLLPELFVRGTLPCNLNEGPVVTTDLTLTRFHSILIHKKTIGGQPYAYCCFIPCGSEQMSLNCIFFQLNISPIPILNIQLDLLTVSQYREVHLGRNLWSFCRHACRITHLITIMAASQLHFLANDHDVLYGRSQ